MDDQNIGNQNKDASGDSIVKDSVNNDSPRMNEAPAREEALPTSGNISSLENISPTPTGDILKEESGQSPIKTSTESQDDLDEDFESYMDDSSL